MTFLAIFDHLEVSSRHSITIAMVQPLASGQKMGWPNIGLAPPVESEEILKGLLLFH
jgi:hypothetical protein